MKVILYMVMTLNGYIAKENDETPWSDVIWKSYYKMAKKFRAIILGHKTYEIMKSIGEFKKIGNPFTIVLTNRKFMNERNCAFVRSPKDAIKLLKEKKFTKVLVGGGGKTNASFMKENLINEIYLDVEPVLFGKGIRLFADNDFESKLRLIGVKKLSKNEIQLHYEVKK